MELPLCSFCRVLKKNRKQGAACSLRFPDSVSPFPPLLLPPPSLPFASVVAILLSLGYIPDSVLSAGDLPWGEMRGWPSALPSQVEPLFSDSPSTLSMEHLRGLWGVSAHRCARSALLRSSSHRPVMLRCWGRRYFNSIHLCFGTFIYLF